jgi:ferritin-like metal-binding protein YciE
VAGRRLEEHSRWNCGWRQPIEESRDQARRLEDLMARHDTSHSSFQDTMISIPGSLATIGHSIAPDEVVKNTFANFAYERYEIAGNRSLLVLADLAGHSAGISALQESLREEQDMAAWIADRIDPTVRGAIGGECSRRRVVAERHARRHFHNR